MKECKTDNLNLFHMDNMELMKKYEDNHFDLAIVDPPYFSGPNKSGYYGKDYSNLGVKRAKHYNSTDCWEVPTETYFNELKRVSKNQIIWGANHFSSNFNSSSPCWIVWDKLNGKSSFADCELAYASFGTAVRKYEYMWNGMHQGSMGGNVKLNEIRIHPTQKPAALYQWLLKNYAKPNDKILDTHLGSGSIAVACENGVIIDNETVKFNLTGCELDEEYFDNMCKRIEAETQQQSLF